MPRRPCRAPRALLEQLDPAEPLAQVASSSSRVSNSLASWAKSSFASGQRPLPDRADGDGDVDVLALELADAGVT